MTFEVGWTLSRRRLRRSVRFNLTHYFFSNITVVVWIWLCFDLGQSGCYASLKCLSWGLHSPPNKTGDLRDRFVITAVAYFPRWPAIFEIALYQFESLPFEVTLKIWAFTLRFRLLPCYSCPMALLFLLGTWPLCYFRIWHTTLNVISSSHGSFWAICKPVELLSAFAAFLCATLFHGFFDPRKEHPSHSFWA